LQGRYRYYQILGGKRTEVEIGRPHWKEDIFFKTIQHKRSILRGEDVQLVRHYESCRNEAGVHARIEEMIKLIEKFRKIGNG
jgi:hypothetical protein